MKIIWYMIPEILSITDRVFSHFGPFFGLSPPSNPENQNFFKNEKKTPGDIIILHKYTLNDNHMIYGSWDVKCNRQDFFVILDHDRCNFYFSFWAIFCPFTHLTSQEMKISKNEKKSWRYHHLTQVYQKSWSYAIMFLRYGPWHM